MNRGLPLRFIIESYEIRKNTPKNALFSGSRCVSEHLISSHTSGFSNILGATHRIITDTHSQPNRHEVYPVSRNVVTQVAIDPEVRDNLLSECSGLSGLVDWLDSIARRPGLKELDNHLSNLEVNLAALKGCIGYADDGYQRNVIKKSEHYELVAICWTPGQATPIHDHVGSDCAFLIVDGVSTETIYETDNQGLARPINTRHYQPGEVCAAEEPDIHRVSNDTDSELVNLHVYTPPLHAYKIYAPAE